MKCFSKQITAGLISTVSFISLTECGTCFASKEAQQSANVYVTNTGTNCDQANEINNTTNDKGFLRKTIDWALYFPKQIFNTAWLKFVCSRNGIFVSAVSGFVAGIVMHGQKKIKDLLDHIKDQDTADKLYDYISTNFDDFILIKRELEKSQSRLMVTKNTSIKGKLFRAYSQKYHPDKAKNLPNETRESLRIKFDLVSALAETATGKKQRFSTDY